MIPTCSAASSIALVVEAPNFEYPLATPAFPAMTRRRIWCGRPGFFRTAARFTDGNHVIQDLGSGLNYDKRGLRVLIKRICSGAVARLVLTHKDRLLRFGAELVFSLCEQFGTEVVIINRSEDSSYEEDLTRDALEIITVFSARLYGSRSHKNRKLVQSLKEAAEAL